jgi:hypothetical protein
MNAIPEIPMLTFPLGFNERDEWEMERKGFVYAFLEYKDGRKYSVMFIDPVRLRQDIQDTLQSGSSYYFERNMVVLPDVTMNEIQNIIPDLIRNGFLLNREPESNDSPK